MIVTRGLTKRYDKTLAVDGLSFTVSPGVVTGFLGPNGSGKSTTMRMILGLDRPDAGSALDQRVHLRRVVLAVARGGGPARRQSFPPGSECRGTICAGWLRPTTFPRLGSTPCSTSSG